jgi:hypothetical protein
MDKNRWKLAVMANKHRDFSRLSALIDRKLAGTTSSVKTKTEFPIHRSYLALLS